MKWHPDKNPNNKKEAKANFKRISKANEVLSDPQRRAIYNQYGEEGLKKVPPPGSSRPSYRNGTGGPNGFNPRNVEDIFTEFFGSSPFGFESTGPGRSSRFQSEGRKFGGGFGCTNNNFQSYNETTAARKPPPVESKLPCTLEELYTSSTRKMKISRTIVNASGRQVQESKILTINVKPVWKKGRKITFPDKGNEQPNQLPADLVFVIDEKPHDLYKRYGNDLIVNKRVSLAEALGGTTINLTTLDGGGGDDTIF
ncbi:hypothetical protein E1A91_D13G127800v1 [Gossypium mustelinum]|uniref:J domain-containing protein n=1 Tax=Gossypium mustelinum TaxID=34275 RepID=A0A5D2S1D8_GOSMU|nr:hypothetical protein E1A91_D13G127800v1 [Gossypium mustelinum]